MRNTRRWSSGIAGALAAVAFAGSQAGAQVLTFSGTTPLNGAIEIPVNASPATGTVLVTADLGANTLRVQSTFSGLLGLTTAAHIHCCLATPFDLVNPAPVATTTPSFPGFPLGVTGGVFDQTYDLLAASTYRAGFITGLPGFSAPLDAADILLARHALIAGLSTPGVSYFNIHTGPNTATGAAGFPGGEIRAFLAPTAVPEPSTYALMATGLIAIGGIARRRRA